MKKEQTIYTDIYLYNTQRTLAKSPGYLKLPVPLASLIRLIIAVAHFITPSRFKHLVMSEHLVCHFTLLVPC